MYQFKIALSFWPLTLMRPRAFKEYSLIGSQRVWTSVNFRSRFFTQIWYGICFSQFIIFAYFQLVRKWVERMLNDMRSRQTGQTSSLPTRGGRRWHCNDPGWTVPRPQTHYNARLPDAKELPWVVREPMVKGKAILEGFSWCGDTPLQMATRLMRRQRPLVLTGRL